MPGMPLQVICYERADDISFGVSGVVTRARGIRASFPDLDPADIPMAAPVTQRESWCTCLIPSAPAAVRSRCVSADRTAACAGKSIRKSTRRFELPYVPPFLHKDDGFVLSIGQFNQWVGSQLMASGAVQIWPGMPVR